MADAVIKGQQQREAFLKSQEALMEAQKAEALLQASPFASSEDFEDVGDAEAHIKGEEETVMDVEEELSEAILPGNDGAFAETPERAV
jgi:hypothetical protein